MYQQFYNFSAEPFRLSPDHGFAYAHKGYTKARAYMDYAFMRAEGFVMITGRPGTGKTTLIGALVDELANTSVSIANLVCTQLQADDLLKLVAYEFGISVSVVEKGELVQRLTQQLKSWHREGRRALLIVDEAQDLSVSAMEELRLLTNIQVDSRPLLQIFLLGQAELQELILSPRLEQVHQRIIAASHLRPLEIDETEAYIRHRLEAVHWRGDPAISKAVYPLVYKFSEGIPRRINLIFSRLLLHCAVEQKHRVAVADLREVVRELQDEKLASGAGFSVSDFEVEDVFPEYLNRSREARHKVVAAGQGNGAAKVDAEPLNDHVQVTRTASSSGKMSQPGSRVRSSGSLHGDEVEQGIGSLTPTSGHAMPQATEAGQERVAAGKARFRPEATDAGKQRRVVPGPGKSRTPNKDGALKIARERAPHQTGLPDRVNRASGHRNVDHRAEERGANERRKARSGSGSRGNIASPAWPIIVIVLATFLVIAYGTWI